MNDVLDRHLLRDPERPFSTEPYPGLIARPNRESPVKPLAQTYPLSARA